MGSSARTCALLAAIAGAASGATASCGSGEPPSATTLAADAGPGERDGARPLCVDGVQTSAYPEGPFAMSVGGVVPPDLRIGEARDVVPSYFAPCDRARILVVRTSAAFCGPCRWHLANDGAVLADPRFDDRLRLLDLVVADEDNMPPGPPRNGDHVPIDAPPSARARLAIDARFSFRPAHGKRAPLPLYVFVDTTTMRILSTLSDPDPQTLENRLAADLAALDGVPAPQPEPIRLHDGLFTDNQRDLIVAMKLDETTSKPPPDPTNAYADDPRAAALGAKLFSDKGLSPSGTVSCATCHDPAKDLTDGAPQATGLARLDRNAPAIALSAHARWQLWDGRAETLWIQALGPIEDEKEMGSSRAYVAQQIAARYAAEYGAVFGAKYPLPADVATASADEITRVFVNVGKAIAAFERTLRVRPNTLDAYAGGDRSALTPAQKRSLRAFFDAGCAQCHWGPRLSDDAFHVVRFPTGRQDGRADPGRFAVLGRATGGELNVHSKWSDGVPTIYYGSDWWRARSETMLGAFKTPTLRGLPKSGPYGHGGTHATLRDVAKHYGERGIDHADPKAVGTTEQWIPELAVEVQDELPAFLEVLTGDVVYPALP